jgi:transposase-like protein
MAESFVRFLCPSCDHAWEGRPHEVAPIRSEMACPNCDAERRVAELLRTDHDLNIVKEFQ